jgi:hypothetical protein
VDEIRGVLSGANDRRSMPVAVTVDFFAGCDGETYSFPETEELEDGRLASRSQWLGRHGLLVVGYEDDPGVVGGGYFIIRNSLGEDWGDKGYGRMPYAYLECFALEAGTILQSIVDYAGDGYGGQRVAGKAASGRGWSTFAVNFLVAAALVAGTVAVVAGPWRKPTVPTPSPVSPSSPMPVSSPAFSQGQLPPRAIPQDGEERVPCVVRISARAGKKMLPMLKKMLPDVDMTCEEDELGVTCRLMVSRRRFLVCARAVQRRFGGDVYLSGRSTCMEIVEKDENPDYWMSD